MKWSVGGRGYTARELESHDPITIGKLLVESAAEPNVSPDLLKAAIIRIDRFDRSLQMEALVPMVFGHIKALDACAYSSVPSLIYMRERTPFENLRMMLLCASTYTWNPAFYAMKSGGLFYPFGISGPGSTLISFRVFQTDVVTTAGMYMILDQMTQRHANPYSHYTSITAAFDYVTVNHGARVFEPFRPALVFHLILKLIDMTPGYIQSVMLATAVSCLPRDLWFYSRIMGCLEKVADAILQKSSLDGTKMTEQLLSDAFKSKK